MSRLEWARRVAFLEARDIKDTLDDLIEGLESYFSPGQLDALDIYQEACEFRDALVEAMEDDLPEVDDE